MRASSTASLSAALVTLTRCLGATVSEEVGYPVAEECFAVAQLVSDSSRLSRCLTDPARSAADKCQLVDRLFASHLSDTVLTTLHELCAGRWSDQKDFAQGCRLIATHVLLRVAHSKGTLDRVERDVFAVGQLLAQHRELRGALADNFSGNSEARVKLLSQLIQDRVDPLSLRLIQDVVRTSKAGRLQSGLRSLADAAAAVRNRAMATVISATELNPTQLERIAVALSRKKGQEIVLNTVVDPTVVGGIKIRYADSVVDGSVRNLLNETRRQLAG